MVMAIAAVTRQRLYVEKPIPGYLLQPTAIDMSKSPSFRLEFSTQIFGYIMWREKLTFVKPRISEREEVRANIVCGIQKDLAVL